MILLLRVMSAALYRHNRSPELLWQPGLSFTEAVVVERVRKGEEG